MNWLVKIMIWLAVGVSWAQIGNLPTTWKVNGNGYEGLLVINRVDQATGELDGTLLGTPFTGFIVGRHIVLHRQTQIWDGWLLDRKLGAQGQPYYNGTLTMAGLISESKPPVDGVYPWYAVAQSQNAPPSNVNLIQNGSFEKASPGNGQTSGIANWQVIRDNVDVVRGYWQKQDGHNSIDLAGTPGSGAIQQSFATTPGRHYEVSFFMAGNPACENVYKHMRVTAGSQSADFQFSTLSRSLGNMGWRKESWTFKANAAMTTLKFENNGPNRSCGVALDNVVVLAR